MNAYSRSGDSRLGALLPLIVVAALGAGCGDGPICQSEVLVIIQSPSGAVVIDSNLVDDGVQTDVRIRSTVGEGEEITVEVLDDGGAVLASATGTTDASGDVTIEDLDLPDGAVQLRAAVDAGECGSDEDVVDLEITVGDGCEVSFDPEPIANDFYAPLGVLGIGQDTDPVEADFQGEVVVTARGGFDVELFVLDTASGTETSVGTEATDDGGEARFAVTLGQGRQTVRAVCASGAGSIPSTSTTVFVDTEAPACAMTFPVAGTSITPSMDGDGDLSNGVQLTIRANASGGDVEGEPGDFVVTVDGLSTPVAGTTVDAAGDSTADATIDPASTPVPATFAFSTVDHAGNGCSVNETYQVVYDGCAIAVTSPTGTVTSDADADPANGAQLDVVLDVDVACAGQTVTSDCGLNAPSGVVAGDGSLTLRVDMCGTVPCDAQDSCTFTVSNPAGIETSAGALLDYDDQAPPVGLQVVNPARSCPAQVTPADDIDGVAAGVQIRMRVVSPLADDRQLEQTDGSGTLVHDANGPGGDVVVTLAAGVTSFVGIATDDVGNSASTPPCEVTLSDIAVTFSPPAADGGVGIGDGAVSGSDLTFDLCGTVSDPGATVTVTVDGGAGMPASLAGNTWCVTLTLAESPPSYTIVATAINGALFGQASLVLTVDLSVPDTIADLVVVADTRQSLEATWTAPSDGGAPASAYVVKYSTTELTEGNFDTTGFVEPTGTPQAPGTPETERIAPLRTGTPFWVGVAAIDSGGNRGPAAIVGPVTPLFDQSPALLPPVTTGDALFGLSMARGKFNDDELWDVAIAAPGTTVGAVSGAGAVYVYFGTSTGISDVPDVVIEGGTTDGSLGLAITSVRWSSANRDDLVIGEPYADNVNGRVHIFHGGAGFVAGTFGPADADLRIGVHGTTNYFTFGGVGWSLASPDFDGDGVGDLAIGVPGGGAGGSGNGGVAIIYGGTVSGSTVNLSDTNTSQLGGAVVHLIDDPVATAFDIFGNYVFDLGPTMGGTDATDDLLISYADGANRVFVYRGTGTRPAATGVHARAFAVGQDVQIQFVTADATNEFGSSAGSLADQNSDGAREIVIGAYRDGRGKVLIIDGNTTGTAGVASTATAGVVLTQISADAGGSFHFGAAIVNNAIMAGADVDGDGAEDLVLTERLGPNTTDALAHVAVWFGGTIPTGTVSNTSADHVITGPSTMNGQIPPFGGTPHSALWCGDVNGDGLSDIMFGDGIGNSRDGSAQLLWDDGN